MSAVGGFNIGGLASGLDTNAIISQLMEIERAPIRQWTMAQAKLKRVDAAWTTIVGKLSAARASTDNLVKQADWAKFTKATSSDESVLTVSATGSPTPGAVSLTVEALAYAQQRASDDNFASLDATMGTRELEITTSSGSTTITPDSADTTLAEFVDKINKNVAEVRAQAVQVSDGEYELVITARDTGTDNGFTVTATNWTNPWTETQAAADAQVRMGDPDTGLLVTRSSNTISDLVDGVTINLKNTSATAVTITTERNVDAAVAKVGKWVSDLNGLLQSAKDLSKYDAEEDAAEPLNGDSTLRGLVGAVLRSVTDFVTGVTGDYDAAATIGLESTKEGLLTLDEGKLREALTDDFQAVTNLFARTGSTSDTRVSYVTANDSTIPGTYDVVITQAAQAASVTGDPYVAADETLTITSGSVSATVNLTSAMDVDAAVTEINTQLDAEGITTLRAENDGGAIRLVESRYGSAVSFSVSSSGAGYGLTDAGGAELTHTGQDVAGTIDGVAGTGKGQTLTVDSDGDDADGLVARITATQTEVDGAGGTLALGTLTYSRGLAGRMSTTIDPYEGTSGHIQTTRDSISDQIDTYDERIERLEQRLATHERNLRRQFTAMEEAMGRLTQQGDWLTSQLAGLQNNWRQA